MKKECEICGDTFSGRRDKRFCSDQCRSAFNNRLNSDVNNYMRNINNILRKNRRILKELNTGTKTKIHRDKLLAKGYNFDYLTNIYTTRGGRVYHFCYEHGYFELGEKMLALVIKKEYVDQM